LASQSVWNEAFDKRCLPIWFQQGIELIQIIFRRQAC
jgi:hypothetical protein